VTSITALQHNKHPLLQLLGRLHDLGLSHIELGAKHPVPEAAGDAEAVLVVGEVVLEVVLLEGLVESWEPGSMLD